jgi:alkylhydroperoxidase family enzyme
VLPLIYPGQDIPALLDDIDGAAIPELHKLMFNWVRKFTRESAAMTMDDIRTLRQGGVSDRDIVTWAQVASVQNWFVMSADGGGIPLEGDAVVGRVRGEERDFYHRSDIVSASPDAGTCDYPAPPQGGIAWVEGNDEEPTLGAVSDWGEQRYGFMPNLFRALSLVPEINPRHVLALELLERPQSDSLSPRQHAMVRRQVNRLNQGRYFDETTAHFLSPYDDADLLRDRLGAGFGDAQWDAADRTVLDFASKLVRHAYKVTAGDAQAFRDNGLDDRAYIDVLNTTSIQTSLDRLTNSIGVLADREPIIRQN